MLQQIFRISSESHPRRLSHTRRTKATDTEWRYTHQRYAHKDTVSVSCERCGSMRQLPAMHNYCQVVQSDNMENELNVSVSGNCLPHGDHKHYPSGFESSKFRENGISVHITRKKASSPIKEREYFDPFHTKVDMTTVDATSRPSSPFIIDEYGDVAGQYFRDIVAQRPSSHRRSRGYVAPTRNKRDDDHELIFQQTALLPQLKISKPMWTAAQTQHHNYRRYSQKEKRISGGKAQNLEASLSHVMSMIGGDSYMVSVPSQLSAVPVPDVVGMLLYPYRSLVISGSLEALKTLEEGGQGVPISIQHDCLFHDLKNCLIKYLYGHVRMGKIRFSQVYDNLKLWYLSPTTRTWNKLLSKRDWDQVKLLSIRVEGALKLMYDDDMCVAPFEGKDSDTSEMSSMERAKCSTVSSDRHVIPLKMSLLDSCRQSNDKGSSLSKQEGMADRLEQKLMLSRRL